MDSSVALNMALLKAKEDVRVEPIDFVDKVLSGKRELAVAHEEELAPPFAMNADVDRVRAIQESGVGFAFGAFAGDTMIGYACAVIGAHHLNPEVVVCQSVAIFIAKPWRGTGAGGKLMTAIEDEARSRGAHKMNWHLSAKNDVAERLRNRPGYSVVAVSYFKALPPPCPE